MHSADDINDGLPVLYALARLSSTFRALSTYYSEYLDAVPGTSTVCIGADDEVLILVHVLPFYRGIEPSMHFKANFSIVEDPSNDIG